MAATTSQSWYEQDPNSPTQKRVIPGAGTYLQNQAGALNAYQRAVAQLTATRQGHQIQSGMGKDWSVDPNAQYGTYQQMLQGQGSMLDQADESSQQRGFFGAGLGNQAESPVRYGNAVAALGFQNQMADWENQYNQGMTGAKADQEAANLAALQGSYDNAYTNQDYTQYDPTPQSNQPNPNTRVRPVSPTLTRAQVKASPAKIRANERKRAASGRAT